MAGGRRRGPQQALQKDLARTTHALAGAAVAVGPSFVPDEEVQVKRVVVAVAEENDNIVIEWSLIVAKQTPVTAGHRDESDRIVKSGFATLHAPAYVDFTTTIRLQRGDTLGLVLENISGVQGNEAVSLVVLFKEM